MHNTYILQTTASQSEIEELLAKAGYPSRAGLVKDRAHMLRGSELILIPDERSGTLYGHECIVIDFRRLRYSSCPRCQELIDIQEKTCKECGFHWNSIEMWIEDTYE